MATSNTRPEWRWCSRSHRSPRSGSPRASTARRSGASPDSHDVREWRAEGGQLMTERTLRVAIVAYQGVLADESRAFRDVLRRSQAPRRSPSAAHSASSPVPAAPRSWTATFERRRPSPTSSSCPGGLGSHRHPEIALWLAAVATAVGADQLDRVGPARRRRAAARPHGGHPLARRPAARAPRRHGVRRPARRRPAVRHVLRAWPARSTRGVRRRRSPSVGRSWWRTIRRQLRRATRPTASDQPVPVVRGAVAPSRHGRRRPTGGRRGRARGTRPHVTGDTAPRPSVSDGRPWHHRRHGLRRPPDERWSSNVVLGNGETVHIRPIRPDDAPALAAFHERQSPREHLPPLLLAEAAR